jgi:hypothetical protein
MPFTLLTLISLVLAIMAVFSSLILLFFYLRLSRHYDSLTRGIEEKTLMNALEGIQKTLAGHEHAQELLKNELQKVTADSVIHLQHLTLKRFNPFGDTGGDQSFILAILDGNNDGVVITSLHSRENTRFYVKSVKGGVGIEHPLSPDEQKLITRKGK